MTDLVVKTVEELKDAPEEYREAIAKLVISHADQRALRRAGVRRAGHRLCADALRQVADLPRRDGGIRPSRALQAARHPDGHSRGAHDAGRRQEAAVDLRVPAQDLGGVRRHQAAGRSRRDPAGRGPAALHLPSAAQSGARDHAGGALPRAVRRGFLGRAGQDAGRQGALQAAVNEYWPYLPKFFGGSKSKNNEIFRKWKIKQRTNDEMREDFVKRATEVAAKYGLTLPEVRQAA